MPEKTGNEDDESWTQTSITITPEENGTLRSITETAVISGVRDTPLDLGVDQITDRRNLQMNTIRRDLFIDNAELEEIPSHSDAGCQTFLQGVPKVDLPSVLRDEATQTMFLGNISPHTTLRQFQDIARIMNDRVMPIAVKMTEITQTVITCVPEKSREYIIDRLANGITPEELLENNYNEDRETTASHTCATDNLHFILDRVLWLSDPGYHVAEVKLKDEAAQTFIKYDHGLGKIVLDADTQTSLTCEPKCSNTGLLSEWSAMKEFAQKLIDECLETGVYPRTVVHSILDEVVDRCACQIHLPYRDETVQTLAPCNALKDKDDEVLRKLRLGLVLDTLESSVIVLPLVDVLLEKACLEIREEAPSVAAKIVNRIERNSVSIAMRLAAIRQEAASHKPMDDIFEARKKRLRELLRDKRATKLSSSTQTELAGVPDVMKVEKPRETICSTCVRHSECYVCKAVLDDESGEPDISKRQDIVGEKMLRTQDILIAYNPCYLVTTPSKIPKIPPPLATRRAPVASNANKRPRPLAKADLPALAHSSTSCRRESDIDDVYQKSVRLKRKVEGSSSADINTIPKNKSGVSSTTCISREPRPPNRECGLSFGSVKALSILKKTFNRSDESCSDCSYDKEEKLDLKQSGMLLLPTEAAAATAAAGATCTKKSSEDSEDQKDKRVKIVPIIHLEYHQID